MSCGLNIGRNYGKMAADSLAERFKSRKERCGTLLVSLDNIKKSFGSELIFSQVSARIEEKDRIGLVGINGAGKTTLLNTIYGDIEPDEGEISRAGKLSIGYQRQNSGLTLNRTIIEEMRDVFKEAYELSARLEELAEKISQVPPGSPLHKNLSDEYQNAENRMIAMDGYSADVKINTVLFGMGFAQHGRDKIISTLSGGEQTRLAIAKLLLEAPNLLILDEPTNHLDFKTLIWLEDYLAGYRGALLIVSHDRYFLDRVTTRTWELEDGSLTAYPGGYSKYLELRSQAESRTARIFREQQEERAKLADYVAKNLVRASTTKMAQSRRKQLEKLDAQAVEKPHRLKPPKIRLSFSSEPVKNLLSVQDLSICVGSAPNSKLLVSGVNFEIKRGDKVAIIGGNGTGKTSLLRCLISEKNPSFKEIEWGRGVKISYYEQGSDNLDPTLTVLDTLWKLYPSFSEVRLRTTLGAMGLTGDDVFKRVSQLSGGERARLKLAAICLADSNVLILDEPTNHLDLATKEVLEEALREYEGTIILVSHDRYLLDRIPNRIFALEDGVLETYKGKYSDYLRISSMKEPEEPKIKPSSEGEIKFGQATYNKGREQRREQARLRKELADTEASISLLEKEIADIDWETKELSESGGDYIRLGELCSLAVEKQHELSEQMERWVELSSQIEASRGE